MNEALVRQRIYSILLDLPAVEASSTSLVQTAQMGFTLFKRAGSRNPKLIGSDNSFPNEGIPEATVSILGLEAFHQLVGSTPERDQTRLSELAAEAKLGNWAPHSVGSVHFG